MTNAINKTNANTSVAMLAPSRARAHHGGGTRGPTGPSRVAKLTVYVSARHYGRGDRSRSQIMRRVKLSAVTGALALIATACSGSSPGEPAGGTMQGGGRGGTPAETDGAGATDRTGAPRSQSTIATRMTLSSETGTRVLDLALGETTAASLFSMKYYIKNIVICENLETRGSGTGQTSGCLTIYNVPENPAYAYDQHDTDFTYLADAARASDDGFIDLIDATSRAKLTTTTQLGPEHVHGYNYGAIYWNLPVKVRASIPMVDETTYHTHDGPTVRTVAGQDNFASYPTVSSTSLLDGEAEEATILHPNGGTWFKFQAPLLITQDDLDKKTGFVLDLTFNPEGLIRGASWGGPPPSIVDSDDPAHTILVPMLDLTPVPHRESETAMKETYLANVKAGDDDFDVRLELYYVDEDAERTIYGASARTLFNARSKTMISDFQKIAFVNTNESGDLEFQAYDKSPTLTGFTRGTAEGDTSTATLYCSHYGDPRGSSAGVLFANCDAAGMPITFTLQKVSKL